MLHVELSSPATHAMNVARTAVHRDATAEDARALLRERRLDHFLFYVYVVDEHDHLLGQVSARRLLMCRGDEPVIQLMHRPAALVTMHHTVDHAYETLAKHRLLAVPVVDDRDRLLGVIDVTAWTTDAAERVESSAHEFFGRMGAAVEEHRMGGPFRGFRLRMPWLLCNIASGVACAVIAEAHKDLLSQVVLVAAFIPLVLTVTESVGVQAAELSVQLLRSDPSAPAFRRRLGREGLTSLGLGTCTGLLVGAISLLFGRPQERFAMLCILACSVASSTLIASMIGSWVPRCMARLGADPRLAAGPVTLMAVDVASTLTYLTIAGVLLTRLLGS